MRTVLLVDDDVDDLELLENTVLDVDPTIDCRTYRDCESVLEALDSESFIPDAIFLDINMPGMKGDQCMQKIRQVCRLSGMVIAMVSTSMEEQAMEKLLKAGADFALRKPYRIDDYTALVKRVLDGNANHSVTPSD